MEGALVYNLDRAWQMDLCHRAVHKRIVRDILCTVRYGDRLCVVYERDEQEIGIACRAYIFRTAEIGVRVIVQIAEGGRAEVVGTLGYHE